MIEQRRYGHLSVLKGLWAIIINWNNAPDTCKAIESLELSSVIPEKIIVVDNGSTDDSVAHLSAEFPSLEIFKVDHNVGFAHANNIILQAFLADTSSKYALLLNNDAEVDKHTLQGLLDALKEHNDFACASPLIEVASTGLIWFSGGQIDWWRGCGKHELFHQDPEKLPLGKRPFKTQFITGCVLLLSRQVLETVGYLDQRFFMYGEDVDFSLRLTKSKIPMLICPGVKAKHKVASSSDMQQSGFIYYHMLRNRLLNARKHARGLHLIQFLTFYPIQWLTKAVLLYTRGQRIQARSIIAGMCDGLTQHYSQQAYTKQ